MSGDVEALSEREKETLRLLLSGYDAKSLARHFNLSVHTINDRLREARRKLGVSSSREAARLLARAEGGTPQFSVTKKLGIAEPAPEAAMLGTGQRLGDTRSVVWFIGGMITVSLIIVAAMLAVSGRQHAPTIPAGLTAATQMAAADSAGVDAAKTWVGLLDAQNWAESWRAAGSIFKTRMPETRWASTVSALRQTMGKVASRTLRDAKTATSLPGAPDGQYKIVQFQTSFANKADAVETVVLAHQDDGWKVDGYFIR